jgi:hypothetical protein
LAKIRRLGSRGSYLRCENVAPYSWINGKVTGYRGSNCYATHLKSHPCSNPVTGMTTQCFDEAQISEADILPKKREPVKDICKKVAKLPKVERVVKDTINTGLEHGFDVCEHPNGDLKGGKYCSGTGCSVQIEDCEENVMRGSVHSHPNAEKKVSRYHTALSKKDMISARSKNESFQCIVYPRIPPNDNQWRMRCMDMNGLKQEISNITRNILDYNKDTTWEKLDKVLAAHKRAIRKGTMCEIKVG